MRTFRLCLVLALAAPLSAQQPTVNPPIIKPPRPAGPVVTNPQLRPPTLKVDLKLPLIESVARVGPSPGPAADDLLLNSEAIVVRGKNLGSAADGSTLALRRSGKIVLTTINLNVPRTATEIGAYVPDWNTVSRSGLGEAGSDPFELVLLDKDGKVVAAKAVKLGFRSPRSDFDLDGSTPEDGDCNDFDKGMLPGLPEVCDQHGKDEDCDLRTYGSRDMDGDGFDDAKCFNLDDKGNRVSGGRDCNDENPTANPTRPENCRTRSGSR